MTADSLIDDFMEGAPALRLVDEDRPETLERPEREWAVIRSHFTNEDRRRCDAELQALGWKRTVVNIHDKDTGEVTGKLVFYSHPDHPNDHNAAGWTQQTAYLMAGLATGRVKVDG